MLLTHPHLIYTKDHPNPQRKPRFTRHALPRHNTVQEDAPCVALCESFF